jgi:hypothetical protein
MHEPNVLTELQAHIARSYFGLRAGLIGVAIILPVVVPLCAAALGLEYQRSLSDYYHANGGALRDVFVGLLFVVGALLFLYKGYSHWEDWLLNAAGTFVVGVALVPMKRPENGAQPSDDFVAAVEASGSLHGCLAIGFFLCIAAVCIFCARKTLVEVKDPKRKARYTYAYRALGVLMVAAPFVAWLMSILFFKGYAVILVESFCVLAFGLYWLVKTIELEKSNAEQNSLTGKLDLPVAPATCDELAAARTPVDARG